MLISNKAGYYEYSKTIYLKKGKFKVYFNSQDKLQQFLTQQFMLLEVKTVSKYKSDSFVDDNKTMKKKSKVMYLPKNLSEQNKQEPFFDKAFNQIKGLIYGYVIGSLGTLDDNEQGLVSDLMKLKNIIGGVHTDIVLAEQYSNFWLANAKKQIKYCYKRYFDLFQQNSTVFDTLILRLEEIDNLNKMRCDELSKQKSPNYRNEYKQKLTELEKEGRNLYDFELKHDISICREELQKIKDMEKKNGAKEGKQRKYFKKGSYEHTRKKELKRIIEDFEKKPEYDNIRNLETELRNYQFGGTQFDTSINEQFNRISEQLNDLARRSNNFFLSKNNKQNELPDISFKINLNALFRHYFDKNDAYNDFSIQLPEVMATEISKENEELLKISLNAVLSFPQGHLGNYSEDNILKILEQIGKHLPESEIRNTLREYYKYRTAKSDDFIFPNNDVLANLIVFFMKLQGHEQINKLLVAKGIQHKQIAFMLYGAYIGFANMPKTFTNIFFDSGNEKMFEIIDNYLFDNYLND